MRVAILILLLWSPLSAQHWRPIDLRPGPIAYDPARGRMLVQGGMERTFESDGSHWLLCPLANGPELGMGQLAHDLRRNRTVGIAADGTALEWDGVAWRVNAVMVQPTSVRDAQLAFDAVNGETLLFGDSFDNSTWTWNGARWFRRQPAHSPPPTMMHVLVGDPVRGVVLLFGGYSTAGLSSAAWEWDGTDWRAVAAVGPSARSHAAAAYDARRGRIVVVGGLTAISPSHEVWDWDGVQWAQTTPLPRVLGAASAAYDTARGVLVVIDTGLDDMSGSLLEFDGQQWQAQYLASVNPQQGVIVQDPLLQRPCFLACHFSYSPLPVAWWQWNGRQWQSLPSTGPLPWRESFAAAADRLHNNVVVFGGATAAGVVAETWTGSNAAWQQATPAVAPSPRLLPGMAWDGVRNEVLLFGGAAGYGGTLLGDCWSWDGARWRLLQPANSPPARQEALLAEVPNTGEVLLCGGRDAAGTILPDAWLWDGSNWTQVPWTHGGQVSWPGVQPTMLTGYGDQLILHGFAQGSERTWVAHATQLQHWFPIGGNGPFMVMPAVEDVGSGMLVSIGETFAWSEATVTAYSAGCPGRDLALTVAGISRSLAPLRFEVSRGAPGAFGVLVFDTAPGTVTLPGGCQLAVAQPSALAIWGSGGSGFASLAVTLPTLASGVLGLSIHAQAAALDATAPGGFVLSQGIRLTLGL